MSDVFGPPTKPVLTAPPKRGQTRIRRDAAAGGGISDLIWSYGPVVAVSADFDLNCYLAAAGDGFTINEFALALTTSSLTSLTVQLLVNGTVEASAFLPGGFLSGSSGAIDVAVPGGARVCTRYLSNVNGTGTFLTMIARIG